ncbi:lipid A biosynthesis acyltransferase [Ramlibacter sp. AW1]|uniref:Lipid A biosynthesis acyltransferase n=1 Tax=Ramlibacter aurantiacus TaxID=2801330 RepID=A0A937D365_9BURK|nr:lipid A biosynthesis acyltransferase [Ramlibacter aurantiacus]MBL0422344.1 lipid A biosynthesis acyltransferase [Ramlibacter aurantiacus]
MNRRRWRARLGGWVTLGFLWLFHWLPLSWQAAFGRVIGGWLWQLAGSRRRITLRNLQLCLPELSPADHERLGRELFKWFSRSVLERGLLWWAPESRLRKLIHVEGDVGFADRHEGAVMWLAPHFVGLDVAGAACQLFVKRPGASIYQSQTNPVIDAAVRRGRLRHGRAEIFARSETAKPLMRAVRQGAAFFNLPDMDFGARDAAFVPFFGVPAATLLAPSRMARALRMTVQPVVCTMLPGGEGYRVRFLPPWEDFPSDDAVADTARMNRWIEERVRECPEQYFWVHKRFKTRPPGEPPLY